jgi:hypothetical protein
VIDDDRSAAAPRRHPPTAPNKPRRRWLGHGGRLAAFVLIPAIWAGVLVGGAVPTPACGAISTATGDSFAAADASTATATPGSGPAILGAGSGPIDVPPASTHQKLVFAHYFPPFPISLDNKPAGVDYYSKNYLSPDGEDGKFASSCGFLRDRPLPSAPLAGDWKLENQETEVSQAIAAGIDGFSIDILDLTGSNWDATVSMMAAAQAVSPNFKIMLMPDMNATTGGYDQATLASRMATLASFRSAYRIGTGALMVAPFEAEARTPSWWTSFIGTMSSDYAITVAFMPVFLTTGRNIAKYAPISYALSSWGARNPESIGNAPDFAAQAHALGREWMAPIAVQDSRPSKFVYAESANTESLRASWSRAIADDADFAQLITWNDYSEMTGFAPSVSHGYSFLDINAYYQTAFQVGSYPAIAREAVFVTHRTQPYNATPVSTNRQMRWWNGGTSPRDTVEVLTFLNWTATVTVTIGASVQTYAAPAGVSAKLLPLSAGTVTAVATRGTATIGTVDSPFTVTNTPYVQDEEYFAASSLRP